MNNESVDYNIRAYCWTAIFLSDFSRWKLRLLKLTDGYKHLKYSLSNNTTRDRNSKSYSAFDPTLILGHVAGVVQLELLVVYVKIPILIRLLYHPMLLDIYGVLLSPLITTQQLNRRFAGLHYALVSW
jgi:hypothetical protein